MNTGIFYLYEFKDTHKLRNTGFLKLTKQEHTCFLQFHARSIPVTPQDSSILSAFYLDTETITAKQLCKIPCLDHTISDKTIVSELDFPSKHTLNEIDGFFLELPNGSFLTAMSPNIHFDSRKILYTTDETEPTTAEQPMATEEPSIAEQPMATETPTIAEQPTETEEPSITEQPEATKDLTAAEGNPKNTAVPKTVRKIQRRELSCLPRHYWNLANNSFLLHGYYNYNHLLLVEEDGHYWLGVPGVYDPRESHAAELFGFSKFTDAYNQQLDLSDDECSVQGTFGYWCRFLR